MKVHIEGNLYLESDERQFILKEYTGKVDEKGVESSRIVAYLSSVEHAFRFILRRKIMESTAANVRELIAEVKRIEAWLHTVLGDDQPRGEGPR